MDDYYLVDLGSGAILGGPTTMPGAASEGCAWLRAHRMCPPVPRGHAPRDAWNVVADLPNERVLATQVVEALSAASVAASLIDAVKAEAGRRILDIAPDWRQRNLTARAAELALLYPGTKGVNLPEPERSEYLAGQAIWDQIKAVRAASGDIEVVLMAAAGAFGATEAERVAAVLAININAGWPE